MTTGLPIPSDLPLILHELINQIAQSRAVGAPQAEVEDLIAEYRVLRAEL